MIQSMDNVQANAARVKVCEPLLGWMGHQKKKRKYVVEIKIEGESLKCSVLNKSNSILVEGKCYLILTIATTTDKAKWYVIEWRCLKETQLYRERHMSKRVCMRKCLLKFLKSKSDEIMLFLFHGRIYMMDTLALNVEPQKIFLSSWFSFLLAVF